MSILKELRRSTADLHAQLDSLPPLKRLLAGHMTITEYRLLLVTYHSLYTPFKHLLYERNDLCALLPDLPLRRKSALLRADLHELGMDDCDPNLNFVDRTLTFPPLAETSHGLGCIYVLEGSTLGAQVIRPRIMEALALHDGRACSFFACYGSQVFEKWNVFENAINQFAATPRQLAEMQAGAQATFILFIIAIRRMEALHEPRGTGESYR